jgi:hypothetical protein
VNRHCTKVIAWSALVMTTIVCPSLAGAQIASQAQAQGGGQPAGDSQAQATALAKQTQNPVASLISVPLQANWDFGLGDRDAVGTLLDFQPVMPFGIPRARTSSCGSSCRSRRSLGRTACA